MWRVASHKKRFLCQKVGDVLEMSADNLTDFFMAMTTDCLHFHSIVLRSSAAWLPLSVFDNWEQLNPSLEVQTA